MLGSSRIVRAVTRRQQFHKRVEHMKESFNAEQSRHDAIVSAVLFRYFSHRRCHHMRILTNILGSNEYRYDARARKARSARNLFDNQIRDPMPRTYKVKRVRRSFSSLPRSIFAARGTTLADRDRMQQGFRCNKYGQRRRKRGKRETIYKTSEREM